MEALAAEQAHRACVPFDLDFLRPDYTAVYRWRAQFLQRIRETNSADRLKVFYRANPIQFVIDWSITLDPRNVEIGLPSKIPFILFPRQIEWCEWILERWQARERGVTVKSRGSGMSWITVCLASTLCLFNRGLVIGFGSRKAEYVDQIGDPKSLFFKARMFLENLPPEFRGGWNAADHSRQMRIMFPETESVMSGESGDGIGRGDRTSLYFVDEAAFLEHPDVTEGSLSDTTNCRIDISTPNGPSGAFYDRLQALPERQRFKFHYNSDPRRDEGWRLKKLAENVKAIFDQEYDCSFDESGTFFLEQSLLVEVEVDGVKVWRPVPTPQMVDCVYAVIDTAVKTTNTHDGLAVTYFALDVHKRTKYPLVILDYDLTQIEGAMQEVWLPGVFKTLEALAAECHAIKGSIGAFIEDKQTGSVLLQQAANRRWPARAINSKLTAMGKDERAINISGYVHRGLVKVAERAYNRVVNYKGITKNHLMSQILSFKPGRKDGEADDCRDTFSYGCAIGLGNPEGF